MTTKEIIEYFLKRRLESGDGLDRDLHVVLDMLDKVLQDEKIKKMLELSLLKANFLALEKMDKKLYSYFDVVYKQNGWPIDVNQYKAYVYQYMTSVPLESRKIDIVDKRVLALAKKLGSDKKAFYVEYTDCVYNEICHFYWLVNQEIEIDGNTTTLQSVGVFASWLKAFGLGQGVFMNTEASLTPESLLTFKEDPRFNFDSYSDNIKDWVSFNTFFSREFNKAHPITGISPERPITHGKNIITSPADCTFMAVYRIDDEGNVLDTDQNPTKVTMKGFSTIGTVGELLQEEAQLYWKDFYGGTFIHYFLSPYDYHRFHTPVDGTITVMNILNGQNYCEVNILPDGQFDAPDDATNGYEFQQQRGLIIVENEELGSVATLPIGMAQVSGVIMYKDQLLFRKVPKGQEFGRFVVGGSDIIMLIAKPIEQLTIIKDDGTESEPHWFKCGEKAVTWNPITLQNEE